MNSIRKIIFLAGLASVALRVIRKYRANQQRHADRIMRAGTLSSVDDVPVVQPVQSYESH